MSIPHSPLVGASTFSVRGTRAEISSSALLHNLEVLKARAPGCEVCAVVKANGYGLGAELVAGTLAQAGVQRFGVATVEEGLALRAGGISGTILVLGGAAWVRAPALLVEAGLTPILSSPEEVALLETHLAGRGAHGSFEVHLGVDTGMSREGFYCGDGEVGVAAMIDALVRAPHLVPVGVMTHFANADLADGAFTDQQVARFATALDALRAGGVPLKIAHIANSAAVLSVGGRPGPLGDARFDDLVWWARPGLALSGTTPFPDGRGQQLLQPAVRFVGSVVIKKEVPAQTSVSYGSTFVTERPTTLAVLGVGYADGYHRRVSGQGAEVLIAGHRAPLVGRVCMDLCMVDLTDLPAEVTAEVGPGTEVTLVGADGDAHIDPWTVAAQAETIAYEVLTSIAQRVPRVAVR